MVLRVAFREQALTDLEAISAYISAHDTRAAGRVIQRIHAAIFRTLTRIPTAGRWNAERTAREFPVPGLPYLVIYVATGEMIGVVGVFHTSRDPGDKPRA
jgi:toxin ParE1/3/4